MSIQEKIKQGKVVLMDGATGTEMERRKVPMTDKAWSSMSTKTHPEVLKQVHIDYINMGVDLIIANSYSCSKHLLTAAGVEAHFEELNKSAVSLAIEARDSAAKKPITVAGSISTTQMFGSHPPLDEAYKNYVVQAQLLKEAGADIIMLEMMRELSHTQAALDACLKTGLPVWLGFSCFIEDGEVMLFDGNHRLETAMTHFKDQPIEVISIMHTLTQDVDACLDVVQKHWDGPLGVYAHSGEFIQPEWQFIDMITPDDYADNCERWLGRGVTLIGGCCGIGPEHIEELKKRLED